MRSHRALMWAASLNAAALIALAPGAVRAQDVLRFGDGVANLVVQLSPPHD